MRAVAVCAGSIMILAASVAVAQDEVPIIVSAGMTPVQAMGTVTADQPASAHGANCFGTVTEEPTQTFTVTESTMVNMVALSETDTVLIVRNDDIAYCNDDADGSFNPRVSAVLEPGEYEVFVGTYLPNVEAAYTLSITSGTRALNAVPTNGNVALTPDFTVQSATGLSGGTMPANVFGMECRGNLPPNPQHVSTVGGPTPVVMDVTSTGDTTLVVVAPNAVYCNDDTNGFNPQVVTTLAPGTNYVYVGNYFGTVPAAYTLTMRP